MPPPKLSGVCRVHAACAAGRLDNAYWLIGPGSAGLAQGCRCALPLQAWAGAYRGGRPPTADYYYYYYYYNFLKFHNATTEYEPTVRAGSRNPAEPANTCKF